MLPRITPGRYFRIRRHSTPSNTRDNAEPQEKPDSDVYPPIVIETTRWTAIPDTFTVREDAGFIVQCTVVHPFKKSKLAMFRRSKSPSRGREGTEKFDGPSNVQVDLDGAVTIIDKASNVQWVNIKSSRRTSGWAGVFAGGSRENPVTRTSFIIDHANDRLLVPDVDVGVAFLVREESEAAGKEHASDAHSEASLFGTCCRASTDGSASSV